MRKPLIALGGLTALGLLAVPIVQGGDTDKPTPFSASSAAADDQLPAFADCDELLDWYVEQALPLVGPYGFGWGYGYYARNFAVSEDSVAGTAKAPVPAPVPAAVPDSAVSSSDTGTNVQEQGVDEPDFAKTNGSIIVRIHDRDLVITDITGDQPVTLSSTRFPRKVYPEQLLLVGNRVLVLGTAESHGGPVPLDYGGRALVDTVMAPWGGNTELFTFDISDPENPELVDRTTYEGRAVEARQYGDVVRLVLSSGLPEFDFVQPTRRRTEAQAERMNKKIVRESTITDWLPSKVPGGQLEGGERVPLVDCEQVRHPKQDKETAGEAGTRLAMGQEAELGNLSIVTLSAATPESHQAVTITTNATQAYSSQGHLYVATTEYVQGQIARDLPLNDQDDLDDTASSDMGSDDMGTDNAEDIGEEVVTEPAAPPASEPVAEPLIEPGATVDPDTPVASDSDISSGGGVDGNTGSGKSSGTGSTEPGAPGAATDPGTIDEPVAPDKLLVEPDPTSDIGVPAPEPRVRWIDRTQTRVYGFKLTDTNAEYIGSGTVPGYVQDRWSFDEHDGYLRVASHVDSGRGGSNRITVLTDDGSGSLVRIGSVGNLGPREQIQSVRWFDDLAVLVTFRQIDPLYTIDLSDPTAPQMIGELKIPGFSSYLHPIGGDQLIGIGTAATMRGRTTGGQVATFDLSDLRNPEQIGYLKLKRNDYLMASDEPHAFTYLPGSRTMFTSVENWARGGSYILRVEVGADGSLTKTDTYQSRYSTRILPVDSDRVALVGDAIRLVDVT